MVWEPSDFLPLGGEGHGQLQLPGAGGGGGGGDGGQKDQRNRGILPIQQTTLMARCWATALAATLPCGFYAQLESKARVR